MSCVEPSCSWYPTGEEARFTPLYKPSVFACFRRWKPPACFLLSHQEGTAAQESPWSWNKMPYDAAARPIKQDLQVWDKWAIEVTKQVSRQGPGSGGLVHQEWMWLDNANFDHRTMVSLIQDCRSLAHCDNIHAFMIKQGCVSDAFLGSTLIDVYAKCGSIDSACMVFLRLPEQDVVTWSAVIFGYALHGFCEEAFQLFHMMQQAGTEPNEVTCISLIKACSNTGALTQGRHIHVYLANRGLDSDCMIGNSLSDMYMRCGSFEDAALVFRKLPSRDVVAWNVLIGGYAQNGDGEEALKLFQQMQKSDVKPNETTFVSVLQACADIQALGDGEQAHRMVLENGFSSNVYVGNSLVHMYKDFGRLEVASTVFLMLPYRDVVTWNTLISGFSQHGCVKKALELYGQMKESKVTPTEITFTSILNACSSEEWLEDGMRVHCDVLKSGNESKVDVRRSLICMYGRCGSVEDVKVVVHRSPHIHIVPWNDVIMSLIQHKCTQEQMQQQGIELNEATCICMLGVCSSNGDVRLLMEIHAYIVENGLETNLSVVSALTECYSRLAGLKVLCLLFNRLPLRDVAVWTVVIEAYEQEGHSPESLGVLQQMIQDTVESDIITLVCILRVCSSTGTLITGMQAHSYIIKFGFDSDTILGNALISMYIQCGSLNDSLMVFDCLVVRDAITWNALLTGFVQCGLFDETLQTFRHMDDDGIEADQVTLICVLQACANVAALEFGQGVHTLITKRGLVLDLQASNTLIDMYAKCDSSVDAAFVFSNLVEHDVVSWNVLIGAAAKEGLLKEAFHLFNQMRTHNLEPNEITCATVLQSCSLAADRKRGMQVHSVAVKKGYELDAFVGSSLIEMYSECKSLQDAYKVFESLPKMNASAWNTLIAGYIQNGQAQEAYNLFQTMQVEGVVTTRTTFFCILQVFSSLDSVNDARKVHALIIEKGLLDTKVSSCLIDMYGRCWDLESAAMVFNQSHVKDLLLWNALIASHFDNGHTLMALQLFKQMQLEAINPDRVMFMLILKVCSSLAALEQGKQIHSLLVENGLDMETSIGNTLIDMYTHCGSLEDASIIFKRLPQKDTVTWSAMISGYAEHTAYALASGCFEEMHKEGLVPDDVAYLSMLSACNNAGLISEGSIYFKRMRDESGIEPMPQHHNCMVDLLGRNGYINEAKDLLDTLPYVADIVAWTSLLGSCKLHRNLTIARQCFDLLKNKGAAGYVHMSSLYALLGMQVDCHNMELARKNELMWKKPGRASIEINGRVHEFVVGDNSHPQADDIYVKLKELSLRSPGKHSPSFEKIKGVRLHQEMVDASCGHCEKLAVAFGLLSLPEGTTIRISKNLRVCSDCHSSLKMISKNECREIVIVDTKYVHHFKDGVCGCKGYG